MASAARQNNSEQESIPVGCVLPALSRTGGSLSGRTPWIETPPKKKEHGTMHGDSPWKGQAARQEVTSYRPPPPPSPWTG